MKRAFPYHDKVPGFDPTNFQINNFIASIIITVSAGVLALIYLRPRSKPFAPTISMVRQEPSIYWTEQLLAFDVRGMCASPIFIQPEISEERSCEAERIGVSYYSDDDDEASSEDFWDKAIEALTTDEQIDTSSPQKTSFKPNSNEIGKLSTDDGSLSEGSRPVGLITRTPPRIVKSENIQATELPRETSVQTAKGSRKGRVTSGKLVTVDGFLFGGYGQVSPTQASLSVAMQPEDIQAVSPSSETNVGNRVRTPKKKKFDRLRRMFGLPENG